MHAKRDFSNSASFLGARSSVAENRRVAQQVLKEHSEDLFRLGHTGEASTCPKLEVTVADNAAIIGCTVEVCHPDRGMATIRDKMGHMNTAESNSDLL